MQRIVGSVCGLIFLVTFNGQIIAADLKSTTTKDGRVIVSFSGEIAEGDTDSFKTAVKVANAAGKLVTSVRLNSIGGNLLEGVKLAEAIRFGKIATNVGQGATCASACFLVFAAGERKFANYTAQIGVHGASDRTGAETVQSGAATVSMARVAKDFGVPPAIIGRMVVTPPNEMVWLTPQDLQSMGTSMVGQPAQIADDRSKPVIPNQTGPGAPLDIQSSDTRAKALPTWDEIVDKAWALSARQNNGRAKTAKGCQPAIKLCFTAVIYNDSDGAESSLKIARDMNDKIVKREICSFNGSKDVRKCFNWDTGTTQRDMLGLDGEWSKVADE